MHSGDDPNAPNCACGVKAARVTSRTAKNPGREFFGCNYWPRGCGQWIGWCPTGVQASRGGRSAGAPFAGRGQTTGGVVALDDNCHQRPRNRRGGWSSGGLLHGATPRRFVLFAWDPANARQLYHR